MKEKDSKSKQTHKAVVLLFKIINVSIVIIVHIANFISRIRLVQLIKLQLCILEAKSLHKLTGKQYHVFKFAGKTRVASTTHIKYLRKKRVLNKSFDSVKLREIEYYSTK